jgi:LmbE family N-acetylglucosaminyl deacetylase
MPLAGAGQRMAVVVAHPDDETFGCGSLIAHAAAAGAQVTVICATRGELGERRPDGVREGWPLGLVREAELCEAAAVLGVGEVVLLDHRDSGFDGAVAEGALVAAPIEALAIELATRLAVVQPEVVLTLDGSDGHRDHVHLRDALHHAVGWLEPPARLVHSCLPNSLMRQWAAVMAEQQPDMAHLAIDVAQLGRPDDELTVIDTSAVLEVRERAIACHRSQASPYDGLPSALRRAFLAADHVIDATPAAGDAVAQARVRV